MTNKSTQEQLYAWPLLVILVILLVGFFIVSPKIANIKDLNTQIAAKEKDIEASQKKIVDLNLLKVEIEKNSADYELLQLVIPEDDQIAEIVEQIVAMANKSGMQVTSIKPDNRIASSKDNEKVVNVSVSGDYQGLISFSENLEKNNRPISFKSVVINSTTSSEGNMFEANIAISFFVDSGDASNNSTTSGGEI